MNIDLLCMGCMNEKGKDNSCPHCGFNEKQVSLELSHFLPIRTILNGQYVIGQVLGSGGFGITYLAWDLVLESKLAIKEFFPSEFVTRVQGKSEVSVYGGTKKVNFEQSKQAFLDEARKLVKFEDNPGVVSVRTYFEANGTAYIVMPYLEGLTLKEYLDLKEGKLSFEQALSIMNPVLNALKEVHQHGLLHRDISPDNIYLTNNGQVKLLDFGAARYAIGDFSKSLSVILKHGYAPLEQYQSKGAQGPWTDIYAVAATIYRMVSGKMLPEALERLDDDPLEPLANLGVIIPPDAEKVLFKALAVRPKNRYQYVLEFQDALKETVQIPEFKIDKYIVVNCPCCGEQNRVPFHAAKLLNSVECKTCSNSNTPPVANEIKPEIIGNKDETEIINERNTEYLDQGQSQLINAGSLANGTIKKVEQEKLVPERLEQEQLTQTNITKMATKKKKLLIAAIIVSILFIPSLVYGISSFLTANPVIKVSRTDNESKSNDAKKPNANASTDNSTKIDSKSNELKAQLEQSQTKVATAEQAQAKAAADAQAQTKVQVQAAAEAQSQTKAVAEAQEAAKAAERAVAQAQTQAQVQAAAEAKTRAEAQLKAATEAQARAEAQAKAASEAKSKAEAEVQAQVRAAAEAKAAQQLAAKELADIAETKRLADIETKRLADIAEAKRLADIETKRLADIAEAKRLADLQTAVLTPPKGLTVNGVNKSEIYLSWNIVEGAQHYNIYVTNNQWIKIGETTENFFRHTGLQSNTAYVYKITTVNARGESEASFGGSFTM